MNRRTQVLIALGLVALGVGAWALSLAGNDASVRRVEDVVATPSAYSSGEHVLLGVPQPERVPVSAQEGTVLRDNPAWSNSTSSTVRWTDAQGSTWYSTRIVSVRPDGDAVHWSYSNETRRLPSDPDPVGPARTMEWTTDAGTGRAFAIEAFHDSTQDTPRIWGLFAGPLKDPMQPKPSQFTGHLLSTLPDGRAVPDGAFLFGVEEFKAGCSSKFLPPEEKQRLEESGDL